MKNWLSKTWHKIKNMFRKDRVKFKKTKYGVEVILPREDFYEVYDAFYLNKDALNKKEEKQVKP